MAEHECAEEHGPKQVAVSKGGDHACFCVAKRIGLHELAETHDTRRGCEPEHVYECHGR